jgi:hypothetical protein
MNEVKVDVSQSAFIDGNLDCLCRMRKSLIRSELCRVDNVGTRDPSPFAEFKDGLPTFGFIIVPRRGILVYNLDSGVAK